MDTAFEKRYVVAFTGQVYLGFTKFGLLKTVSNPYKAAQFSKAEANNMVKSFKREDGYCWAVRTIVATG